MIGYVFGYGSLLADMGQGAAVATLDGHVRVWDVAMDNREEIGGYKYYADPASGARPAVFVTFVDLAPAVGRECVGFLIPVDAARLAVLDLRERNYDRVEVARELVRADDPAALAPETTVWTYMGKREARQRHASAVAAGTAVVARSYLEKVEGSFSGAGLWPRYAASTRPPECPVVDLMRVDLPLSA